MLLDGAVDRIMGRINTQFYAILDEIKQIRDYLGELVELAKEIRDGRKPHKKYRGD